MITFLFIYFLIYHIPIIYCYSFHDCGISYNEKTNRIVPQIVGGRSSSQGSWPWVVSIHANGKKICTGSIISRNYVLTAAHCFINQGSDFDVVQYSIHAGSIYAVGGGGMLIDVETVIRYDEFYNKDDEFALNEITLLKLERPLTFNRNIRSICLPKSYRDTPLNNAYLAGFGELDWRSKALTSFKMFETRLSFQDFSHCQNFTPKNFTSKNYVCLGAYKEGSGSGDSGGPLMVKLEGNNESRWFEVGILVGAYYSKRGPQMDWSHIASTRVSSYCDWIEDKTDGEAKCNDIDNNNIIMNIKNIESEPTPATTMHPMTIFENYTACLEDGVGYEKLCVESQSNGKCERYDCCGYDHIGPNCVKSCGYYDKMKPYIKERFKRKPPTNSCHDKMPAVLCYIQRFRWGYCGSPLPHSTQAQTTWKVNYGKQFVHMCPYTCEFC